MKITFPEEEKTRRFTLLQEQQRSIQMRLNARYVGKREHVTCKASTGPRINGLATPASTKL